MGKKYITILVCCICLFMVLFSCACDKNVNNKNSINDTQQKLHLGNKNDNTVKVSFFNNGKEIYYQDVEKGNMIDYDLVSKSLKIAGFNYKLKSEDNIFKNAKIGKDIKFDVEYYKEYSSFPAIIINTEDNKPVVSRDEYLKSNVTVTNTDNSDYDFKDAKSKIRGRGNSTWAVDKKSYKLKFDEKTSMLGSDYKCKIWTLLANHYDKSLMRNCIAFDLGSRLKGLEFDPSGKYVDLYLNGEYLGVYQLCDQIKAEKKRIKLKDDKNPEECEYLFEVDKRCKGKEGYGEEYIIALGKYLDIKYPKAEDGDLTKNHVIYLKEYFSDLNKALKSHNYTEVLKYIDVDSFVDFFILQEMFKNVDVDFSSTYFYLKGKGEDRRVFMGPIWDFDLSAGYVNYMNISHEGKWAADAFVYRDLFKIPGFVADVKARWLEIINDNIIDDSIKQINIIKDKYKTSFERNFERWDIFNEKLWCECKEIIEIKTFDGQVDYFKNYLEKRYNWMNEFITNLKVSTNNEIK